MLMSLARSEPSFFSILSFKLQLPHGSFHYQAKNICRKDVSAGENYMGDLTRRFHFLQW